MNENLILEMCVYFLERSSIVLEGRGRIEFGISSKRKRKVVKDGGDVQRTIQHDGQSPPFQYPTRLGTRPQIILLKPKPHNFTNPFRFNY